MPQKTPNHSNLSVAFRSSVLEEGSPRTAVASGLAAGN
jgi:hypothetical protein